MTDDDAKVVEVDFQNRKPSITERKRTGYCSHNAIAVDSHERRVWCKHCEATLDPFDVILGEAQAQTNHWHTRNHLAKEAEKKCKELEYVKRQLRNAKAALRRAKAR